MPKLCPSCGRELRSDPGCPGLLSCDHCLSTQVDGEPGKLPLLTRCGADGASRSPDIVLTEEFRSRFALQRLVGFGSMGSVYLAREPATGRQVAVKFMARESGETLARFLREGRLLAEIHHPNVVRVHEVGSVSGVPYIACEYVDGGTLRDLLKGPERVGVSLALRLMIEVLSGLSACHARRIVHRDLKPANILLTREPSAKIADFGIAKELAPGAGNTVLTKTGVFIGTPAYMSPEHLDAKRVEPGSDVYSAGVILFEMLAGRPPFVSSNVAGLVHLHSSAEPPRLGQFVERIDGALEALVAAALDKNVRLRPSAADFADGLRKALATVERGRGVPQQVTMATPAAPWTAPAVDRSQRPSLSRRTGVVLATVAALGLCLLVGLLRRSSPEVLPVPVTREPSSSTSVLPPVPDVGLEVQTIRVLAKDVESETMLVEPWAGGGRDAEVACPVVLTQPETATGLMIDPGPASVLSLPNGVRVEQAGEMPLASAGLVEGLNWVRVSSPGPVRATIRVIRLPTPVLVEASNAPAEAAVFERSQIVYRQETLQGDTAAAKRLVLAQPGPPDDPLKAVLVASFDLCTEDVLSRIGEVADQSDDNVVWTDRDKLAQCRAVLDVIGRAIRVDPGRWFGWHQLGWALKMAGQRSAAKAALVNALRLWPRSYWSWRELARLEKRLMRLAAEREPADRAAFDAHRRGVLTFCRLALWLLPSKPEIPNLRVEIESELRHAARATFSRRR